MKEQNIKRYADGLFGRFPELLPISEEFYNTYNILKIGFFKSKIAFLCGNGGSESDSEHIVGELSKGFMMKRPLPKEKLEEMNSRCGEDLTDVFSKLQMGLKAMNLSCHPGLSTAFMNDVDPEMAMAQQLFAMGSEGDVVIGISTGGNAKNVLNVFKVAGGMGIKRILLTGNKHGICEKYADSVIAVPAAETYRIQEYHLPIYHALCQMIEEEFYGC